MSQSFDVPSSSIVVGRREDTNRLILLGGPQNRFILKEKLDEFSYNQGFCLEIRTEKYFYVPLYVLYRIMISGASVAQSPVDQEEWERSKDNFLAVFFQKIKHLCHYSNGRGSLSDFEGRGKLMVLANEAAEEVKWPVFVCAVSSAKYPRSDPFDGVTQ